MSTQTRPRQTTFAGGMIVLGSIFLLLSVWESMTGLRGIESREAVEEFLRTSPGNQTGLTVEDTLQVLRVVATVTGACAAVAAVLGVYALQGNRQARMVLSVLAVPIFVTGIVVGGFMSSIVAVAITMLWLSPSREWFRGEPVPDRTTPSERRGPRCGRPRRRLRQSQPVDAPGRPPAVRAPAAPVCRPALPVASGGVGPRPRAARHLARPAVRPRRTVAPRA